MNSTKTIFVQITSYRDPECKCTIRDLFEKASYPERVRIGLNWQYAEEDNDEPYFESPYQDQIRIVRYHYTDSRGACWARAVTQTLYNGEDYYLSLDAHMRFTPGWDARLIEIHERLKNQGFQKPVISYYPPGYLLPGENLDTRLNKVTPRPMLIKGKRIGIVVNSRSVEISEREPFLHAAACANFLFTKGAVVSEVPYDPHLYFYGEEITLAVRLWTNGYDLFHPGCILAYHFYRRQRDPESGSRNYRKIGRHQLDHASSQREEFTYQRVRHLLGGEISVNPGSTADLKKYGLGRVRSLHQFSKYSGIRFPDATVNGMGRLGAHFIDAIPLGVRDEIMALKRAEEILIGQEQKTEITKIPSLFRKIGAEMILDLGCFLAPWLNDVRFSCIRSYFGVTIDRQRAHSLSVYFEGNKRARVRWGNYASEPLEYAHLVYDGGLLEFLPSRVVWQILGSVKYCGAKYFAVLQNLGDDRHSWLYCKPYYLPEPSSRYVLGSKCSLDVWDVHDPRFQVDALPEGESEVRRVLVQLLFECAENVRCRLDDNGVLFNQLVEASLDVQRKDAEHVFRSTPLYQAASSSSTSNKEAISLWWAIRRTNLGEVRRIAGTKRVDKRLSIGYVDMQSIAWTFFIDYRNWYQRFHEEQQD